MSHFIFYCHTNDCFEIILLFCSFLWSSRSHPGTYSAGCYSELLPWADPERSSWFFVFLSWALEPLADPCLSPLCFASCGGSAATGWCSLSGGASAGTTARRRSSCYHHPSLGCSSFVDFTASACSAKTI